MIQVYLSWKRNGHSVPSANLQLVAFKRQFIAVHEEVNLKFVITADQMKLWLDEKTGFGILPGRHDETYS